jgi:hypothetical protein
MTTATLFPEFTVSTARFSPCKRFRYSLERDWDADRPRICFCLLNPSVADATILDPTLRRCVAFSKLWGFGRMTIVNLFALRSTDPRALTTTAGDVVGFENDAAILQAAREADTVLAGWGVHGKLFRRDQAVMSLLANAGLEVYCLGRTNAGAPRHPLYLAAKTKLERFELTTGKRG